MADRGEVHTTIQCARCRRDDQFSLAVEFDLDPNGVPINPRIIGIMCTGCRTGLRIKDGRLLAEPAEVKVVHPGPETQQ